VCFNVINAKINMCIAVMQEEEPGSHSTTPLTRSLHYSPSEDSLQHSPHSDFGTMSSYSQNDTASVDRPIDAAEGPEINEVHKCTKKMFFH
jgi:hypothetical protein